MAQLKTSGQAVERSKMFPALHPLNLKELATVLKHPKVKEAWIHANGNIYVDSKRMDGSTIPAKESSDNAKMYVNDSARTRPAKYRLKFEKGDAIPRSLKELELMFVEAFAREEAEEAAEVYSADDNNFVFHLEDDEPLEETPEDSGESITIATGSTGKKGDKAKKIAQQLNDLKNQNAEVQTVQEVGQPDPVSPEKRPVTAE